MQQFAGTSADANMVIESRQPGMGEFFAGGGPRGEQDNSQLEGMKKTSISEYATSVLNHQVGVSVAEEEKKEKMEGPMLPK